jgi:hypothetical protein
MFLQYDTDERQTQTAAEESQLWAQQLETYLRPYSQRLDAYLDRRVVGNLTATIASVVQTRSELTLSQLGSAICGPEHTEAGTQRLQRALHHQGWKAEVIEELLWDQAEQSRKQMDQRGEIPLCMWDSSVLEKPESVAVEGVGAVRSSRVRRLARSRPEVFNRPGLPVRVRGFEWESLLLLGKSGVPQVVAMRWWTRERQVSGQQRKHQEELLAQAARRWGRQVRHVAGSRIWAWSLAPLPLISSAALCRALEKRQQTAGCLGAGAQSLGNRPWQTALGRSAEARGHALPRLSQHTSPRLAGVTPAVSWPVMVGGGATRQRTRTVVSAH